MAKDIKELKELLEFVCELGNASGKSLEDGKISFSDALHFSKAAMVSPAAFIGIGQVADEYFDLDDAERAELNAFAAEKLDLPQDGIESIVENVIQAALQLSGALKQILEKKKAK